MNERLLQDWAEAQVEMSKAPRRLGLGFSDCFTRLCP